MKQSEIKAEKVSGYCSCGYKAGGTFLCEGMNTPFCGGACMILFPMQATLHNGARLDFETNPKSIACPDSGHVVYSITLLDEK